MKKWITHAIALCIGFVAARNISVEYTDHDAVQSNADVSKPLETKRLIRPIEVSEYELLKSLSQTSMEANERSDLKSKFYSAWVEKDPLGFLEYHENRPPSNHSGDFSYSFEKLAQTQPEMLVAYAKRTGCAEAISCLVAYADPDIVLGLIKKDFGGKFPQDELSLLVTRGLSFDPDFHLKLFPVLESDLQKIVLAKVAAAMKSNGRTDDFFALIQQYPDILDSEDIGKNAGSLIMEDVREFNRLDSLDDESKQAAVKEMLYSFNYDDVSEDQQRQMLASLASRGLLDSRQNELFELMMEVDPEYVSMESAVAWKDWAVSLPSSSGTRPIQLCTAMKWAMVSKVRGDEILKLPEGNLRDGALVGGFVASALNNNLSDAKNMVESISDAETKARMLGYLSQLIKGEEPEDFNPFGIEIE